DEIEHTPKNEVVRLNLGQAFDVTARSRQTDYQKLGAHSYEVAFSVEIKNAKKEAITATVLEVIPGEWKMVEESLSHTSPNSNQAQWAVPVPAEGKTVLTYRLRTRLHSTAPLQHCGRGRGRTRGVGGVRAAAPSPGSLRAPPSPAMRERGIYQARSTRSTELPALTTRTDSPAAVSGPSARQIESSTRI